MEARANFFGDLMKDFEKFTLFGKHIHNLSENLPSEC